MFKSTTNQCGDWGFLYKCRDRVPRTMGKNMPAQGHYAGSAGLYRSALKKRNLRYSTATITVQIPPPISYSERSRCSPIGDPKMNDVTTMVMKSPGSAVMTEYFFFPDTIR